MRIRTICESAKARIAHVGASMNPDNPEHAIWHDSDRWHMDEVLRWMDKNTEDEEWLFDRDDDFIDLNDGRDFLEEDFRYDIVILHMVYHSEHGWRDVSYSPFKMSHLHNPENWRSRLVGTDAKYIFTFGDYDEVSGKYLKAIPGYEGPIDGGNYLSVYVKSGEV